MNDALNQPVVLGQKYGYSTNSSGFTTVTLGTAVRLTEKKVTLQDLTVRRFLYGGEVDQWKEVPKSVSVQSCHLFPIAL